jgi:Domain of unknown function (DUF1707)
VNNAPELRIGDAEREAAATALGEHYAAGRLSKEEYDERSNRVWAAKTGSDLRPLFVDLPALGTPGRPFPTQRAAEQRSGSSSGDVRFRFPWLPVILLVVGLTFLLPGPPWWLLLLGAFVFSRSRRHGCHGHSRRSHPR